MGVSEMDKYVVDSTEAKNWVISGIALRGPLKPILTTIPARKTCDEIQQSPEAEEESQSCCTTPTSQGSRLPSRLVCPPAPKKRKPSSRSACYYFSTGAREFFIPPHDLDTVFRRRAEKA
ncbi:OLC1v1028381C1 [Oldenlandia corymbosa var. corymbosa]|uniref:OLC1v1028381C1 n=1 Tax=Oldenlandia corymbosa var. corymbosa TaxID=529605 RepID=A0AAV1CCR3_OLDCO|nr:OLC1v1028381C1 [Oldenlandia corymbosa var. corymbosa]